MSEELNAKKALQSKLSEIRANKRKILEKIDAKVKEQQTVDQGATFRDCNKAIDELKNSLDNAGKQVLEDRSRLKKKHKKYKQLQIATTAIFSIFIIVVFAVLQLGLIAYLFAAAATVLVYIFPTKFLIDACNASIAETYSKPCILEYDKKEKELLAEYEKRFNDAQEYLQKLKDEENQLLNERYALEYKENEIMEQIEEFDFNYTYRNTILFWGCDRGNHYDIYLDGLHYDTVRGRRIAKITLTPGLHSFKVENTAYNIDNSIIYCYEFPTEQFMAGNDAPCHAIVCEYRTIKEVSGTEFQKITKTKLI